MIKVSQEKYNQLIKAAAKTEVLEKLVFAQKEYRTFLSKHYHLTVSLAGVHGYKTPEDEIALGAELRSKVEHLERELYDQGK